MFKEVTIILLITYIGEVLSRFISTPIPGPVIGMILIFILLHSGILKVKHIENITSILLLNLAILFIPPGVKLISALDLLSGNLIKILILMVLTTAITMVTTGLTVQYLIKVMERKND